MTNTLQPFHDELDDLLMVIDLQARYTEYLANRKLAYTCEQLDHDWALRERAERKARDFKRLFEGSVPEIERWWIPAERLDYDMLTDRYSLNEPWHSQYYSKVLGRWPWYSRFRWLDRLVSWVWRLCNR